MIRLFLGRLLPGAAAIALFASALSPLRPALAAFGAAASALAGDANLSTQEIGAPKLPSGGLSVGGLFEQGGPEDQEDKRTRLRAIAGQFADQPEVPVFGQERRPPPAAPSRKKKQP